MVTVPEIAIVNASTVWSDQEALVCVHALQLQLDRDFSQAWGLDAVLSFFARGAKPPATHQWLVLADTSDQAGAAGYHETTSAGLPLGKAFLATTQQAGGIPSVTVSHELLEMLADPWINLAVANGDNTRLYAREVCDACEDDQWAYQINGVSVSDFVTPIWFDPLQPAGRHFDHMGHLTTGPFTLLAGGYIGAMDISGGGWTQITADHEPRQQYRAHVGSRRERRLLARHFWRRSEPQ
jgi:hypothetical protein